ncbi:hypothetical protein CRYUN_Cryun34aG0018000 [Craigia yunnanensis]
MLGFIAWFHTRSHLVISSLSDHRVTSGSRSASGSKACREKMRRDRLNDRHVFFPNFYHFNPFVFFDVYIFNISRFLELASILDPGRPPKVDKAVILVDAVRMVTQLWDEAQKLRESNESLQEKINELKRLKTEKEKENLERQVKALGSQPGFLPHPPAIPTPFSTLGQVVGGKMVPIVGYPGVSMWQFLPPAVVDTSQDHILRPPVA